MSDSAPAPDDETAIPFTPVPRLRARRRGWSAERQRAFIDTLATCGSVARSARAVGMSARSAYRLLDAPGGDSFAHAWDRAIDQGVEAVRADSLERALGGAFVPVFRRGRLVRVEHRRCDRLAIALLAGKDRSIDDHRRNAVSRRKYRQDVAALDAERANELREAEAVWAEHQAILDLLEAERNAGPPPLEPRLQRL